MTPEQAHAQLDLILSDLRTVTSSGEPNPTQVSILYREQAHAWDVLAVASTGIAHPNTVLAYRLAAAHDEDQANVWVRSVFGGGPR